MELGVEYLETLPDPLVLAGFLFLVGMVPFAVTLTTAFVKIAVVLFLLRSALGAPQTPPGLVLYGAAITLTAYIMAPIAMASAMAVQDAGLDLGAVEAWPRAFELAIEPLRGFMMRFAEPSERAFFFESIGDIWPDAARFSIDDDDLIVLIPAFLVGELSRAFEIGFMLYLPMVAIDLVVANVLMAMGMMMVSPMMISLPFKLLLFVASDGWTLLLHGLVRSYAA